MSWLLLILCLCLLVALAAAAYVAHPTPAASGEQINAPAVWAQPTGKHFRIATYNVHSGKGIDGERDIARAAEVLRGADVAAIQELHAATHFGRTGQAEQLARMLEMGWLFAPTRTRWFREYRGNALLTHFPVSYWYREPLVDVTGHSFRNLTTAKLELQDRHLWILFTHLHPRAARGLQLQTVLDRFSSYSPAVLLGDLNTPREDPQLARLLGEQEIVDAIRVGLDDQDPDDRIDWIITKGLQIEASGMTDIGVSDHPYYWVEVQFAN